MRVTRMKNTCEMTRMCHTCYMPHMFHICVTHVIHVLVNTCDSHASIHVFHMRVHMYFTCMSLELKTHVFKISLKNVIVFGQFKLQLWGNRFIFVIPD